MVPMNLSADRNRDAGVEADHDHGGGLVGYELGD